MLRLTAALVAFVVGSAAVGLVVDGDSEGMVVAFGWLFGAAVGTAAYLGLVGASRGAPAGDRPR